MCSKVKKRWPFTTEDVKRKLFLKRPTGKELIETLKGCGSGGIFAYGIMNTLWYSFGIIAGMYAITSGGARARRGARRPARDRRRDRRGGEDEHQGDRMIRIFGEIS